MCTCVLHLLLFSFFASAYDQPDFLLPNPLTAGPVEVRCPAGWEPEGPYCVSVLLVPPYTECPGDVRSFKSKPEKDVYSASKSLEGVCEKSKTMGVTLIDARDQMELVGNEKEEDEEEEGDAADVTYGSSDTFTGEEEEIDELMITVRPDAEQNSSYTQLYGTHGPVLTPKHAKAIKVATMYHPHRKVAITTTHHPMMTNHKFKYHHGHQYIRNLDYRAGKQKLSYFSRKLMSVRTAPCTNKACTQKMPTCPENWELISTIVDDYAFHDKRELVCEHREWVKGRIWCPEGFEPATDLWSDKEFGSEVTGQEIDRAVKKILKSSPQDDNQLAKLNCVQKVAVHHDQCTRLVCRNSHMDRVKFALTLWIDKKLKLDAGLVHSLIPSGRHI